MNVNYVVNPMIAPNYADGIITQNNSSATDNGTIVDVSDSYVCLVKVSGTFVANIAFAFSYDGTTFTESVNAYDIHGRNMSNIITKKGDYYIYNASGAKALRTRVDSYTSGAVTVEVVKMFAVDPVSSEHNKRHIEQIVNLQGVTIEAGKTTTVATAVDVSKYLFLFALCRMDTNNIDHGIYVMPITQNTLGSIYGNIPMYEGTDMRIKTDWQEVYCDKYNFLIKNGDSSANHVFDLVVFGVM